MGGFGQYYRVIAQSLSFLHKNYIEGEKVDKSALSRLSTFFQYKEAPMMTLGADILRGKNMMGEKFNIGKELSSRLLPMTVQDVYDVLRDDPSRYYLVLPGIFGVGVQTYEEIPRNQRACGEGKRT
ncbi:MAG: hypothetical protein MZV70_03455 [Desulfobacterales bacterium]|nr:hypothetical protein [Desulfobacterales bacterium]